MDRNLIQQVEENKEQDVDGVPVCGANLSSPVFDRTNFIREVHTGLELSSISKMQTRDKAEEKRDLELENIVGNLRIAEFQVDRLRTRL